MQTEQFLCLSGMTDIEHSTTSGLIEEDLIPGLNLIPADIITSHNDRLCGASC